MLILCLFAIMAGLGIVIIVPVLRNKFPPKLIVHLHGIVALATICVMILYMLKEEARPVLVASTLLLILTACLGITIYRMDIKRREELKILVILHPLLAVISLITFVTYLFSQNVLVEQSPDNTSQPISPQTQISQPQ